MRNKTSIHKQYLIIVASLLVSVFSHGSLAHAGEMSCPPKQFILQNRDGTEKCVTYEEFVKVLQESDDENATSGTSSGSNSLNMQFISMAAGSFMMGSPANETDSESDEVQHEVTLTKSFEIQTTEVTQDQWSSLMGNNLSNFKGLTNPVENVSWDDAQTFIQKLNQKPETIKEGYTYRLPTEAEWEFAARGGKKTTFPYGDGTKQVSDLGWYDQNSGSQTHPVMTKKEAYGLFDMHGNVWEWIQDWYGGDYPTTSVTNPTGPSSGSHRVIRGGSWYNNARCLRSANRSNGSPGIRFHDVGFRLVRTRTP